jgi:ergothioneine biosynthesis protein EgtB
MTATDATPREARIARLFAQTRERTDALAAPLSPEDMMLQSMEDASPAKWHLAHTTWFFEAFVLGRHAAGYRSPDPRFATLFNSYYVQAGPRHARDRRGLLSRPALAEIRDWRAQVDHAIAALIAEGREDLQTILDLVELGCHHEMQHQELLLTDLLHGLSFNPLLPAYAPGAAPRPAMQADPLRFAPHPGGLVGIGHDGAGFAYDCEGPRHKVWLEPFALATRLVTNGEWAAFIADGGYETQTLWLSDGWTRARAEGWDAPLYWWRQDGEWWRYSLRGAAPVDMNAPVVHVSYYEAEAFARWAGARLPTEAEWEAAAAATPVAGNFLESGALDPLGGPGLWGDVWQWTQSAFLPYPGFRPADGALGEYNGKFMSGQMVLRGGSCVTPAAQMRASYRTFFYPHQRWQMLGVRLARDGGEG